MQEVAPMLNRAVLMSGADYMINEFAINTGMKEFEDDPFDVIEAMRQHGTIRSTLESAGVQVITVQPPKGCQDGVFTANWALIRGNKAVMASLPKQRQAEIPYARRILVAMGYDVTDTPSGLRSSGTGDAVAFGEYCFMGTSFRTSPEMHSFIADTLGYKVISLQAEPERDSRGLAVINKWTGWEDSPWYDADLYISPLRPATATQKALLAWCPEALTPASQELMHSLDIFDKIEVPAQEALNLAACNLVSTGSVVVMNKGTQILQPAIEAHGLEVRPVETGELRKNQGSIKCSTLPLEDDYIASFLPAAA